VAAASLAAAVAVAVLQELLVAQVMIKEPVAAEQAVPHTLAV
jgi:hypothetical protein